MYIIHKISPGDVASSLSVGKLLNLKYQKQPNEHHDEQNHSGAAQDGVLKEWEGPVPSPPQKQLNKVCPYPTNACWFNVKDTA